MTKPDPKRERLKHLGVLNPHPERVRASWFQSGDFFDANDLIQVKYEMLRHVSADGASKADAAALFGVSRPTFYQAEAAFARDGLAGLVPKQRGPKGAHKLKLDAMDFVQQRIEGDGAIHARALAEQLEAELGISVHPRSIERAIARKKKTVKLLVGCPSVTQAPIIAYDILRTAVIEGTPRPEGAAALRYHGMLHGLPMLVSTAAPIPLAPVLHHPLADSLPAGSDEFVRLLANLVLRTHSELAHVY